MAFDLFPRTYRGKNRCVLRQKHVLINSRERLLKSDINLEQSSHVETVALLTRKKDVERIDIEMTVDKEDMTEKATYQKIKEYVKEKYGMNVHTKYIAEVKRKHGLPMHDASNKVDVPKRDYPGCPDDKVKMIEEAFKFFGIIGK